MEVFYSTRGYNTFGIPSSKELLKSPPQKKNRYWKLYYQNGYIRLKTEINSDGIEKIDSKVFYNDKGYPVLIARPFGKWYNSEFLEYDNKGYIKQNLIHILHR